MATDQVKASSNCPECGAKAIIGLDGEPGAYKCGSEVGYDGNLIQSDPCQELCELRTFKKIVVENIKRVSVSEIGHGEVRGSTFYVVDIGHPMYHKAVKESFLAVMDLKSKGALTW